MIFNMYIYNRKGKCLYYKEWNRPLNTLADDPEEEKKLVFGMLYSLKDMVSRLSPQNAVNADNIHSIKTDSFIMHHYQSISGLVFIMNTDTASFDLFPQLQFIYTNIFVDFVARNPLYSMKPDEPIVCPLFAQKLEEYVMSLPSWKQ